MTENNYTPELFDQNAAYPTAPTYPVAQTYPAAQAYPSTPGYPVANAQYAPNPYAPQVVVQQYSKPSNGMAIAGLVCSFFIPLLGLIFSIIGLSKSKEINGEGREMSIAGIVISCIWFVAVIIWIVFVSAAIAGLAY